MRRKGIKNKEVKAMLVTYPCNEFLADVETLIQKFVASKSIRYEQFTKIWRESNFSLIHVGRSGIREQTEFLEEAFKLLLKYILPPYNLQVRVGGLYVMYGMYHTQKLQTPVRIRIPVSCWSDFCTLKQEVTDQKHLDAVYIIRKLFSERAFLICAYPTTLSVDEIYLIHKDKDGKDKYGSSSFFPNSEWGDEQSLLSQVQDEDNIGQLHAVHEKYHQLKCDFNALRGGSADTPGSSLDLIKPNIARTIIDIAVSSKDRRRNTRQTTTERATSSSDEISTERAQALKSIKSRAQTSKVNSASRSLRFVTTSWMFEVLKRNVMESPSISRLSPPNLSPPPGLLPTLPVASTPNSLSASMMVKQEKNFNDHHMSSESLFRPLPTIENMKQEKMDEETNDKILSSLNAEPDSQMLKQKLEMYWQGMLKYQQQQQENAMRSPAHEPATELENVHESIKKEQVAKSSDVLEKAKHVVQRLIEDDNKALSKDYQMPWPSLATLAANKRLRSPKNGQNKHISSLSPHNLNEQSMQQASALSQQALATMLSLHRIQQHQHHSSSIDLLPPPPLTIIRPADVESPRGAFSQSDNNSTSPCIHISQANTVATNQSTTTSASGSPLDLSNENKTVRRRPTPTSETSIDNIPRNKQQSMDCPLDLSLSVTERRKIPRTPPRAVPKPPPPTGKVSRLPPPLLCVDRNKTTKTASPAGMVNTQLYPGAPQESTIEAHIKNGLANGQLPTTGPFTSLYQSQETAGQMLQMALAAAGGKTLNELVHNGVPPIQIQQWLLAAMNAQKVQQMALNQISLMQQHMPKDAGPPKKRQKLENDISQMQQHIAMNQQAGILRQQNNGLIQPRFPSSQSMLTPGNNYGLLHRPNPLTPPSGRKQKVSPTTSPNSDQNQSGKRYRRYAKPPYSYVSLITLSILSSRDKKLRLSQILKRISEMFPFFNGSYQGWRDSVRHNLSQNECFVKVLKNPYRPTAKGNFWTVNLNSIPHELLLRQNTLVSRYAQDSGYRYRKDLSEVFDLRTGALKVSVPRQLLRESPSDGTTVLADDPAAVMEAILLEETCDDDMNDYKDKIPPEIKHFTLEDLFNQNEDGDEDLSGGRGRGRSKQSHHTAHSQPPSLLPRSFASPMFQSKPSFLQAQQSPTMVPNFPTSVHSRAMDSQNLPIAMMPQSLLPNNNPQNEQAMTLPSISGPNPFAAAQTALLSKALASQLQGLNSFPVFQKMLYANQLAQNQAATNGAQDFGNLSRITKTPSPSGDSKKRSAVNASNPDASLEEHQQILRSDPPSLKRNKRKGIQPVRHTIHEDEMSNVQTDTSTDASALSPPHSFSVPTGPSYTPSRTLSSEADSATTSSNPFCSPVMSSSSSKGHSSPRHDDSSEFEDSSQHPAQSIFSMDGREASAPTGMAGFQSLQMFGSQSLQASKMA